MQIRKSSPFLSERRSPHQGGFQPPCVPCSRSPRNRLWDLRFVCRSLIGKCSQEPPLQGNAGSKIGQREKLNNNPWEALKLGWSICQHRGDGHGHPTPLGWPLGERDNKQTQNSSRGQTVSSRRPGSCLPFHSSMPGAQYSAWHRVSCQERFVERRNKWLVALNHKDKRKMKNAHRMVQQNSGKLLMAAYWREQES